MTARKPTTRRSVRSRHNVTTHPTTQRRIAEACERYMALQKEHAVACNRMWAGTLAANFTADDLPLIADRFSERDRQLLYVMRNEGTHAPLFPLSPIANAEAVR